MQAGYELFDLPQETIDLTFGVVTLATGERSTCLCMAAHSAAFVDTVSQPQLCLHPAIVATILGGVFIDMVGSSIRNSMLFCGWTALVSYAALILLLCFLWKLGALGCCNVMEESFNLHAMCFRAMCSCGPAGWILCGGSGLPDLQVIPSPDGHLRCRGAGALRRTGTML